MALQRSSTQALVIINLVNKNQTNYNNKKTLAVTCVSCIKQTDCNLPVYTVEQNDPSSISADRPTFHSGQLPVQRVLLGTAQQADGESFWRNAQEGGLFCSTAQSCIKMIYPCSFLSADCLTRRLGQSSPAPLSMMYIGTDTNVRLLTAGKLFSYNCLVKPA